MFAGLGFFIWRFICMVLFYFAVLCLGQWLRVVLLGWTVSVHTDPTPESDLTDRAVRQPGFHDFQLQWGRKP